MNKMNPVMAVIRNVFVMKQQLTVVNQQKITYLLPSVHEDTHIKKEFTVKA